jgi:UDP-N-acetylglucosamine--N-acetylmuramyl-(pentapeptide) pyrophosphoryl-undecaprenol N-acetylglucosamine transferase
VKTPITEPFKLIIAGGGTGGHVSAGIAIAQELKEKNKDASILFVGAKSGLEEIMVPKAGFPLILLKVGKLKGLSFFQKLNTLIRIPIPIFISIGIILKFKPNAVIGVGGYVSGPFVFSAFICKIFLRIRTAILEQNVVPGLTNKILSRFVNYIFLAFPDAKRFFDANKSVISGNPIRKNLRPLPPSSHNPFTVFVFGGSQGATGINNLVIDSLPLLNDLNIDWIHQTGEKDFERVLNVYKKLNKNSYRVEKFIHDMLSAYEKASIVICRSGASTLSELARVGRASILIPYPQAADDHQLKNAKSFCEHTSAILINQNEATGNLLAEKIRFLYFNPEKIFEIEKKSRKLDVSTNPAEKILETLGQHQFRDESRYD